MASLAYTACMRIVPALCLAAFPLLAASGYDPRADLDAGHFLRVLGDAEARLRGAPRDPLALAARSQALTALLRLQEALASADLALQAAPGLGEAHLARALALGGLAVQQRNLGSLRGVSRAMDELRAAVGCDPRLVAAWTALGLGYEQLPGILGGSTRKALECADTAARLDPARGFSLKGTILALEGRWQEAQGAFSEAFRQSPGNADTIYAYLDALGSRETRKALGSTEQIRLLAQEARRLRPAAGSHARALCAVADAFIDAGLGPEAWATVHAVPSADAPSLLRLELGKISARTGYDREAGLAALDQVLREPLEGGCGGYAAAHWRRGQILQALGRLDAAEAAARSALALDPNDSKAKSLLKDVQERRRP